MEIACLDLGSNTFHLQHFRVSERSELQSVLDRKHAVRLGKSVYATGSIDGGASSIAHSSIAELLRLSSSRNPDARVAVATAAIRFAHNGAAFVEDLRQRFGLDIEVLRPEEEAELSYFGATTHSEIGGRRTCVIDLGGGSAELAVGECARCLLVDSMPLGSLRLRARREGRLEQAELGYLREQILFAYGRRLAIAGSLKPNRVAFASGTARSGRKLAMVDTAQPGRLGAFDLDDLYRSLAKHAGTSPRELIELGVEPARADTVVLTQLVMVALMEGLGVTQAHVIGEGLREGVALREYRRSCGLTDAPPASLRAIVGER